MTRKHHNNGRQARRALVLLSALVGFWACQGAPSVPTPEAPGAPRDFPFESYSQGTGPVYSVDQAESMLTIRVYREGPLARLGHNHVVSASAIGGFVRPSGGDSAHEPARADLYVPVDALVVDDPPLRAAAGEDFASVPTQQDIDGTRSNMLGPSVLDGASHPFLSVQATWSEGTNLLEHPGVDGVAEIDIVFKVRGVTHATTMPVRVVRAGDRLRVSAATSLAQGALGIEPFSVLGGALRVRDQLDISIEIVLYPLRLSTIVNKSPGATDSGFDRR